MAIVVWSFLILQLLALVILTVYTLKLAELFFKLRRDLRVVAEWAGEYKHTSDMKLRDHVRIYHGQ